MIGPAMAKIPLRWRLCDHQETKAATSATAANSGSKVLMKTPSNCAKKPIPKVDPRAPSTGKHDAHPIAETIAPSAPSFSVSIDNCIPNISKPIDTLSINSVLWYGIKHESFAL